MAEIAIEEGFLYGARSDDIRNLRCNGLIDINWKAYDWEDHLSKIALHKPLYAVVPDILKTGEVERAMRQARAIEKLGVKPILVPKAPGALKLIPKNYIVGVSVPSSYAGYLPEVSALIGRTTHLLGGSPPQQREIYWYFKTMGIKVGSVDINSHSKASDFGSYWNGNKWDDSERSWIGKYEAFRRSCQGIMKMWAHVL